MTMNWKHRALYKLMSDTSEDVYCAGWMIDNEYRLWANVADPDSGLGYPLTEYHDQDVESMREISIEIGGWVRLSSVLPLGPAFIPMDEWLPMYEAWKVKARAEIAAYRAAKGTPR